MMFKTIIVLLLLLIISTLGTGLFHLVKGKGQSDKVVRSLTWRIGLSVGVFILLLIGQAAGLITPHGLS